MPFDYRIKNVSKQYIEIMEQHFSDPDDIMANCLSDGLMPGNAFPPIARRMCSNCYFQKRCVIFSKLFPSSVCLTRHSTWLVVGEVRGPACAM